MNADHLGTATVTSFSDRSDLDRFARAAVEHFKAHPEHRTFSNGEIDPLFLAIRWGCADQAVLVCRLNEWFQPVIFGGCLPERPVGAPPPAPADRMAQDALDTAGAMASATRAAIGMTTTTPPQPAPHPFGPEWEECDPADSTLVREESRNRVRHFKRSRKRVAWWDEQLAVFTSGMIRTASGEDLVRIYFGTSADAHREALENRLAFVESHNARLDAEAKLARAATALRSAGIGKMSPTFARELLAILDGAA